MSALDSLWRDARHALRRLRQDRGLTVAALMSLSLGIGATTAIFQLIEALGLRALPVADPHALVEVRAPDVAMGRSGTVIGRRPMLTNLLWERVRDSQQGFESMAAWSAAPFEIGTGGESFTARGLWVSGDYFRTLGVRAFLGRELTPADDRPGCPPVAVISHAFWRSRYGERPDVLDRQIRLDGQPAPIVGVLPPGFFGIEVGHGFDVAVPLCAEPIVMPGRRALDRSNFWWLAAVGRLEPGWTVERVSAHLAAISSTVFGSTVPPAYTPERAQHYRTLVLGAFPMATGVSDFRQRYETTLWMLLAIAGLVLLVACANLANLLLARMRSREREISLRLAIGASHRDLVRLLFVESAALAAGGGALGLWLAQAMSRLLVSLLATSTETPSIDLRIDWPVLLFATGAAAATCGVFGLAPAIRALRVAPSDAIQGARASIGSRNRSRAGRTIVVAQLAISLVLVVGAGLFGRTFWNLYTVDTGFDATPVVAMRMDIRSVGVRGNEVADLEQRLLDRVRSIRGVESAATVFIEPVAGYGWAERVVIDGNARREAVNFNRVSTGFFATMAVPFVGGRDFGAGDRRGVEDRRDAPASAIVNESFVRAFFPSGSPLLGIFEIEAPAGSRGQAYRIVGVVKDAKYADLRDRFSPGVFVASAQADRGPGVASGLNVVVRSTLPVSSLAASIRAEALAVHPSILMRVQPLQAQMRSALVRERLSATLAIIFGLVASLLAAIGVYGVMAYSAARRTAEIGVRIALGATRESVVRLMLRDAWTALAVSVPVGLALAIALGRMVAALLYELEPADPLTLIAATVILCAVAAIAGYLPARRASRLEPMTALGQE